MEMSMNENLITGGLPYSKTVPEIVNSFLKKYLKSAVHSFSRVICILNIANISSKAVRKWTDLAIT